LSPLTKSMDVNCEPRRPQPPETSVESLLLSKEGITSSENP
jgi:hypothetical protein